MPNSTNTNPLPWKHTHEKEDIKGLDHTRRYINIMIDPTNGNGRWVLLDDNMGDDDIENYDIAEYDLDDPENYYHNKIKTSPLWDYLKEWDVVTIFAWWEGWPTQYATFMQYHKIFLGLPTDPNKRNAPVSLLIKKKNQGVFWTEYINSHFGQSLWLAPFLHQWEYLEGGMLSKKIKLKLKFLTPTQTHTKEEWTLYFITET